jgi:hypothetical protein
LATDFSQPLSLAVAGNRPFHHQRSADKGCQLVKPILVAALRLAVEDLVLSDKGVLIGDEHFW